MTDPSGPGSDPLDTLAAAVAAAVVVKSSRFLADVVPVHDLGAADSVVGAIRRRHHDARHHCSAAVLGPDGQQRRSSDDGEPSGTAGAPMLAVLDGAGLTDVVAVVTRWFGGTLLGTGGLARAYGGAVAEALAGAPRLARRSVQRYAVAVRHGDAGRVEHRLRGWAQVTDAVAVGAGSYDADGATFEVSFPPAAANALQTLLAEDTADLDVADLGTAVLPFLRQSGEIGRQGR